MEIAAIIEVLVGIALAVFGYFLTAISAEIKDVRRHLDSLSLKVAEEYVHKSDLDRIYETLRRIEDKLDNKVDK